MSSMPTYRLTFWLPAVVVSMFLILFGIQAYNEFLERHRLVISNAQSSLNATALQLAHNLEYALANDDRDQAQSHIARFSLGPDARFSILLDRQKQILHASRQAWIAQNAGNILNDQQLNLVQQTTDQHQILERYEDGTLNIIVPLTLSGQGLFDANENPPLLFLESNINYQLSQVSQGLWRDLLPLLILFALATLLFIGIIRGIVLKPITALKTMAKQLSQQQFDLKNPLQGHTEQTAVAEADPGR